jgi:serine/threonine protein kinase
MEAETWLPDIYCHPFHQSRGSIVPLCCPRPDDRSSNHQLDAETVFATIAEPLAASAGRGRVASAYRARISESELLVCLDYPDQPTSRIQMTSSRIVTRIDLLLSNVHPAILQPTGLYPFAHLGHALPETPEADIIFLVIPNETSLSAVFATPGLPMMNSFEPPKPKQQEIEFWIFSVHSDAVSFERLLLRLSHAGAIQGGLLGRWKVEDDSVIAIGGFGAVLAGFKRHSSEPQGAAAIKVLSKKSRLRDVQNEVKMLILGGGHPNIIGFRGVFYATDKEAKEFKRHLDQVTKDGQPMPKEKSFDRVQYALVFELFKYGDLWEYVICEETFLEEAVTLTLFAGVFSALEYLHQKNIIHRDVKCENILLRRRTEAVLADFGLATTMPKDGSDIVRKAGSVGYAPPEQTREKPSYNQKADIFGAGSSMFFVLSRKMPFPGKTKPDILKNSQACNPDFSLPAFENVSPETMIFLQRIMSRLPIDRPSAYQALQYIHALQTSDQQLKASALRGLNLPSYNARKQSFTRAAERAVSTLSSQGRRLFSCLCCTRISKVQSFDDGSLTNINPTIPIQQVEEAIIQTPVKGVASTPETRRPVCGSTPESRRPGLVSTPDARRPVSKEWNQFEPSTPNDIVPQEAPERTPQQIIPEPPILQKVNGSPLDLGFRAPAGIPQQLNAEAPTWRLENSLEGASGSLIGFPGEALSDQAPQLSSRLDNSVEVNPSTLANFFRGNRAQLVRQEINVESSIRSRRNSFPSLDQSERSFGSNAQSLFASRHVASNDDGRISESESIRGGRNRSR